MFISDGNVCKDVHRNTSTCLVMLGYPCYHRFSTEVCRDEVLKAILLLEYESYWNWKFRFVQIDRGPSERIKVQHRKGVIKTTRWQIHGNLWSLLSINFKFINKKHMFG